MIDIHCHILPNMDDGSSSLAESLKMARQAVQDGIRIIVATPHTQNGTYTNTREDVLNAVSAFESVLLENHIDLKISPGSDIHFSGQMAERVLSGEICTIGNRSRHMLLELPQHVLPQAVKNEVFSLELSGITPIITHPERNSTIQRDPSILSDLIQMGALSQATAMSLTGAFGSFVKEVTCKLLKQRLFHIIASDAHSSDYRTPVLSDGVEAAADILGNYEEAERMVTTTPAAILEGQAPEIPEPWQPKTKPKPKRFSWLFRRSG